MQVLDKSMGSMFKNVSMFAAITQPSYQSFALSIAQQGGGGNAKKTLDRGKLAGYNDFRVT